MARMYALAKAASGQPEAAGLNDAITGRVLVAELGDWHLILISGTLAQLAAIAALPASQCIAFPEMPRSG